MSQDLSVVMVLFKGEGNCQFLFNHWDGARRAYGQITALIEGRTESATVEIVDEFGTHGTLVGSEIRAAFLQNQHQHMEGASLMQLASARANAMLQKKAAADPALRFMTPNGGLPPGLIS